MTDTIKYIEIRALEDLLHRRKALASNFGPLGVADACVLYYVKQATFLSKREERIQFHFFQGLNVYPQNLSLFLRDLVQKESRAHPNSKQKLTKGVFIVYDMFDKSDAIVEINIPGAMKIYKSSLRESPTNKDKPEEVPPKVANNNNNSANNAGKKVNTSAQHAEVNNNGSQNDIAISKELLSNQTIDNVYLSAILRSMYEQNLEWGRYHQMFSDNDPISEYRNFLTVFFRTIQNKDIYIDDEFESLSTVRGSHCCELLYKFVRSKRLIHHTLEFMSDYIKKHTEVFYTVPKLGILYAELLAADTKYYRSLKITSILAQKYNLDPFILYYQAKYLHKLGMNKEALRILHSIKQFNQFEVWVLMAEISFLIKNMGDTMLCLNFACKTIKAGSVRNHSGRYKEFQTIGKMKKVESYEDLSVYPVFLIRTNVPMIVNAPPNIANNREKVDPKLIKELYNVSYWKLLPQQRIVYDLLINLKNATDKKKLEDLIESTFQTSYKDYLRVDFKKGVSARNLHFRSQHQKDSQQDEGDILSGSEDEENLKEGLPTFLTEEHNKNGPSSKPGSQTSLQDKQTTIQPQRNLSIIPEIESFIENSVYEEPMKADFGKTSNKCKHILHERLMKLIRACYHQSAIESNLSKKNFNAVLPLLNKIRKVAQHTLFNDSYTQQLFRFSIYVYEKMFKIFTETENYRPVIVLIAELLNQLESMGVRRVEKMPYWVEYYLTQIIDEKGLSFLNDLLKKINFFDETIIHVIKRATAWKLKGTEY